MKRSVAYAGILLLGAVGVLIAVNRVAGCLLDPYAVQAGFEFVGDDAVFAERPWQVSPPYDAGDLVPGGPLGDDRRFPLVRLP